MRRIRKAVPGLPEGFRFHDLRHFYASEELEAGESIVSLARWLGHSDPGFTLRKYSHFLPRAGARGSAAIDAIFA